MADDFIEHFGVKGMKWGQRRADNLARRSAPSEVKVKTKPAFRGAQDIRVTNRTKGRLNTNGGKRNVSTEDAIKTAVTRQKSKASTINALSNKELKDAVTRLSLEKQYKDLSKEKKKSERGRKFAQALFNIATGDILGGSGGNGGGRPSGLRELN